jgi:hypothetical protein
MRERSQPPGNWRLFSNATGAPWQVIPDLYLARHVRVLNDTGVYYRFFDATPHAEFLYECIERTIEVDLPAETSLLNLDASVSRALNGYKGKVNRPACP